MKEFAIPYILSKFEVKTPGVIYCRIDKFGKILNNFSYNNFRTNCKKYNMMFGGGGLYLSPPPPMNIKKFTDKYKNEKEIYKKVEVTYKNNIYIFKMYHDEDMAYYYLFRKDDEDQNLACLHIIVDKIKNICEVHNILYHPDCMATAEMNDKKGSTLIKLAFILINKIKDRYNIKKIYLTDNSSKRCKNKHRIELHKMMTLISGTTWYAKYGFVPKNKFYRKQFEKNKEIMDKVYLDKVQNIEEYIIYGHKKSKSKISLTKILDNYKYALSKNYKLKDFLSKFLLDYDNSCDIFYYFYEELYEQLNLANMNSVVFVKIL